MVISLFAFVIVGFCFGNIVYDLLASFDLICCCGISIISFVLAVGGSAN